MGGLRRQLRRFPVPVLGRADPWPQVAGSTGGQPPQQGFLQFQTLYSHPSGRRRLRITSTSHRYAEPSNIAFASAAVLSTFTCEFSVADSVQLAEWESGNV